MIIKVDNRFYDNIDAFRADISSELMYDNYDLLLLANNITQEFVDFKGPKVFCSWEPLWSLDEQTLLNLKDADDPTMFLCTTRDIERRWFYPAIGKLNLRDIIEKRINTVEQKRNNLCCMINRFTLIRRIKEDLVKHRLEYCLSFGNDIDIYGRHDWKSIINYSELKKYAALSRQCFGYCENKHNTIQEYTFNLCFENSDLDGYITEKLPEAILAGCVPLYIGGGKYIEESIPSSCYINCKDLESSEVHKMIKNMSHDEVIKYRLAGIDFLKSSDISRFGADNGERYRQQIIDRWQLQTTEKLL